MDFCLFNVEIKQKIVGSVFSLAAIEIDVGLVMVTGPLPGVTLPIGVELGRCVGVVLPGLLPIGFVLPGFICLTFEGVAKGVVMGTVGIAIGRLSPMAIAPSIWIVGRAGIVTRAVDESVGAKGLDTVLIPPAITTGGIEVTDFEATPLGHGRNRQTGNTQGQN